MMLQTTLFIHGLYENKIQEFLSATALQLHAEKFFNDLQLDGELTKVWLRHGRRSMELLKYLLWVSQNLMLKKLQKHFQCS